MRTILRSLGMIENWATFLKIVHPFIPPKLNSTYNLSLHRIKNNEN